MNIVIEMIQYAVTNFIKLVLSGCIRAIVTTMAALHCRGTIIEILFFSHFFMLGVGIFAAQESPAMPLSMGHYSPMHVKCTCMCILNLGTTLEGRGHSGPKVLCMCSIDVQNRALCEREIMKKHTPCEREMMINHSLCEKYFVRAFLWIFCVKHFGGAFLRKFSSRKRLLCKFLKKHTL